MISFKKLTLILSITLIEIGFLNYPSSSCSLQSREESCDYINISPCELGSLGWFFKDTSSLKKHIKKIMLKKLSYSPYGKNNSPIDDENYLKEMQKFLDGEETKKGYDLYRMTANDFESLRYFYQKLYPQTFQYNLSGINISQYYEVAGKNPHIIKEMHSNYEKEITPGERTLLIVNSPGGSMSPIYEIEREILNLSQNDKGEIVKEYKIDKNHKRIPLDTYITDKAASAGALLFLLGENRIMNRDAIIMFHAGQFVKNSSEGPLKLNSRECESIIRTGYLPKKGPQNSPMKRLQKRLIEEGKWEEFTKELKVACLYYTDDYGNILHFIRERTHKSKVFVKEHILKSGTDVVLTAEQALELGIATHIVERTSENEFVDEIFNCSLKENAELFPKVGCKFSKYKYQLAGNNNINFRRFLNF